MAAEGCSVVTQGVPVDACSLTQALGQSNFENPNSNLNLKPSSAARQTFFKSCPFLHGKMLLLEKLWLAKAYQEGFWACKISSAELLQKQKLSQLVTRHYISAPCCSDSKQVVK